MAASIYDWSGTAASNSNADADIAWPEGQAPSTVNNSARAMMQRIQEFLEDIGGSLAAGGTANGLTVTAGSNFGAYADGRIVAFRATATNTGAATLSVNGIGAKAIRRLDAGGESALVAGDIKNTGIYVVRYSAAMNAAAGAWLLENPSLVGKSQTRQQFTSSGTWTNPGCRFIRGRGVGGGGGGGGVDGQGAGTAAGAGGGHSGSFGVTVFIDVSAVASGAVVIGAAGVGVSGGAGTNGTSTTLTIGATTYTWLGGGGAAVATATASNQKHGFPGAGLGASTNVEAFGIPGGFGFSSVADGIAIGGMGGRCPYGWGAGAYSPLQSGAGAAAGPIATGYGTGGGGAVVVAVATDAAGGNGTKGFLEIDEYY